MSIPLNKEALRAEALAKRRALKERDSRSLQICERVLALKEYASAATVLLYVGVRSEVRTERLIESALGDAKCTVLPYCDGDRLILWQLQALEELIPGMYKIPEPKAELRTSRRQVPPGEIVLAIVPGIAFDLEGNRLGHGAGYFDRLLSSLPAATLVVALAFECQLYPRVPTEPHDRPVDLIVTERSVYRPRARAR